MEHLGISTLVIIIVIAILLGFVLLCFLDWRNDKKNSFYNLSRRYQQEEQETEEDNDEEDDEEDDDEEDDDILERFFLIRDYEMPGNWGSTFDVYVDRETRVQYIEFSDHEGLTTLIDSNGLPILYTGNFDEDEVEENNYDGPERFHFIEADTMSGNWDDTFNVYVDRETRVQYIEFSDHQGVTPFIGADGKPILYTGDFSE